MAGKLTDYTPTDGAGARMDFVLRKVDFAATLVVILGIGLAVTAAALLAIFETAKLIASLWSKYQAHWVMIVFAVAMVWVLARWKRMCIF